MCDKASESVSVTGEPLVICTAGMEALIPSSKAIEARMEKIRRELSLLRAMLKVAKRAEEEAGEGGDPE